MLHPRLKWRWFDRYWETRPDWRKKAVEDVDALWAEYKDITTDDDSTFLSSSPSTAIHDEWSSSDDQNASVDQLKAYLTEPFAQVHPQQSPIPYWISKIPV